MKHSQRDRTTGLRMPRSRGAVCGLLLVILGAWGALIPFVGPHFNFAYTPDQAGAWSSAPGWLGGLPGVATVLGGLLLIFAGNRVSAMLGGWLAVLAGAWFVIGSEVAPLLKIGSPGDPVAATDRKRAVLEISYFSGLGALIVLVGGVVLARTAVRLARDVEVVDAEEPLESVPAADQHALTGAPVSSGAFTKPRTASDERPRRGWRRQEGGVAAVGWPPPQS